MITKRARKKAGNGTVSNIITPEDAVTVLQQERQERAKQCQSELAEPMKIVQEVLEKHNCSHVIYGQLRSGTWVPVTDLGVFRNVRLVVQPNN